MICQETYLKKNWPFNSGELYIVDFERGERPRESTLKMAAILWPDDTRESTRWFYIIPITFDMRGLDPETDITISSRKEFGRPYVALTRKSHAVEEYRLLSYVGKLSPQKTRLLQEKTKRYLLQQMGATETEA